MAASLSATSGSTLGYKVAKLVADREVAIKATAGLRTFAVVQTSAVITHKLMNNNDKSNSISNGKIF